MKRIQDTQPEPETPSHDGACCGAAGPGDILSDVGCAPEHLCPAGSAEADGEDGQDPAVACGEAGEEVKQSSPDDDEEEEDEEEDGVGGDVLRGEEVEPVATVGRG